MVAEAVPDAKAKTPLYTLSDMEVEALMARMADTLVEPEDEFLEHTSRYVEADTLHDNLVEAKVQTLGDVQFEVLGMVHSR